QFFNNKSIFLLQLDFLQMPYKLSPADDVLQKVGVLALLDNQYQLLDTPDEQHVQHALDKLEPPQQLLVKRQSEAGYEYLLASYDVQLSMTGASAVQYLPLQGVNHQATMAEVFAILEDKREGAVYVFREQDHAQLIGIIRWDQVRSLLVKQNNLL